MFHQRKFIRDEMKKREETKKQHEVGLKTGRDQLQEHCTARQKYKYRDQKSAVTFG